MCINIYCTTLNNQKIKIQQQKQIEQLEQLEQLEQQKQIEQNLNTYKDKLDVIAKRYLFFHDLVKQDQQNNQWYPKYLLTYSKTKNIFIEDIELVELSINKTNKNDPKKLNQICFSIREQNEKTLIYVGYLVDIYNFDFLKNFIQKKTNNMSKDFNQIFNGHLFDEIFQYLILKIDDKNNNQDNKQDILKKFSILKNLSIFPNIKDFQFTISHLTKSIGYECISYLQDSITQISELLKQYPDYINFFVVLVNYVFHDFDIFSRALIINEYSKKHHSLKKELSLNNEIFQKFKKDKYSQKLKEVLFNLKTKDLFEIFDFLKKKKQQFLPNEFFKDLENSDRKCLELIKENSTKKVPENANYTMDQQFKELLGKRLHEFRCPFKYWQYHYISCYISLLNFFLPLDFLNNKKIKKKIENTPIDSLFWLNTPIENYDLWLPESVLKQINYYENKEMQEKYPRQRKINPSDCFHLYLRYLKNAKEDYQNIMHSIIKIMEDILENNVSDNKLDIDFYISEDYQNELRKFLQLFFIIFLHINKAMLDIIEAKLIVEEPVESNLYILVNSYTSPMKNTFFNRGILRLIYQDIYNNQTFYKNTLSNVWVKAQADIKKLYQNFNFYIYLFDKVENILSIASNNQKYILYKELVFEEKYVKFKYQEKIASLLQKILEANGHTAIISYQKDYLQDFCKICDFLNNTGLLSFCFIELQKIENNMNQNGLFKDDNPAYVNRGFISDIMHYNQKNLSKFKFNYNNQIIEISLKDFFKLATLINKEFDNIEKNLKQNNNEKWSQLNEIEQQNNESLCPKKIKKTKKDKKTEDSCKQQ